MINTIFHIVFRWDWRLFASILAYMLLPRLYENYSIYLVGNAIPDTNSLPIVAQWSFIALAIEVLQEALILPLFFYIGSQIRNVNLLNHIKTSVYSISVIFIVFTIVLLSSLNTLVETIGTPPEIQEATKDYLRIRILSIPFSILTLASIVFSQALNLKKVILAITVFKVVVAGVLDSLFFGGYPFSLDYGVNGVALSSLISEATTFILAFWLVIRFSKFSIRELLIKPFFMNWRMLFRVGSWSGLDSLVRNLAYSFMIVRMLNLIGANEIGGYFLAVHILWSFLLVPVLAFGDSSKALLANHVGDVSNLKKYFGTSIVVAGLFALLLVAFTPFWNLFASVLNNQPEIVDLSFKAFAILLIPYTLFIVNTICDSLFYATGKTRFMAYQSLITNSVVYGTAFILYITGTWTPSFESIMLLFGIGIFIDSVFTVLFAWWLLYSKKSYK